MAIPSLHMTWKLAAALSLMFLSSASAQTATEAWVRRYSHAADSHDVPKKVVTDTAGNVIVAGYTEDGFTGADFLTIKYSGAGVPLWTNRYSGPRNVADYATAVSVDASGKVFVTGSSGSNYATVAYSGAGVPLWTNLYHGPGSDNDHATAVAVNSSGRVFVTGTSYRIDVDPDYATVAYSGAGVPLWTNRYNGQGTDYATAVAVDGSGHVFVTGYSLRANSLDYATVAYSAAGVPLWTNLYNGPHSDHDFASALAVDAGGNVFVTGNSWVGRYSDGDIATVAYSGAGIPLWTNRYNGPDDGLDSANAIAVDGNGNVFVTGHSDAIGGGYDYVTLAYSGAGVPLWINRYTGPGNSINIATGIGVDGSNRVFVTGRSKNANSSEFATVAYTGAGVPVWTNRYSGLGIESDSAIVMAVDSSSRVFVTGPASGNATYDDFTTIAYSGAGEPVWTNRYDGLGNRNDEANAVAVDSSGNMFVTGYSQGIDSGQDYATVAYSSAGVPLWTNRYNGPGNGHDAALAVAVDGSRNVYVTGYSAGTDSFSDYATIAYSGAGVPLWTNRYNGPANGGDAPLAMAVDGNGNVYVTGYCASSNSPPNDDFATVAYSSAGVPLWTNRYNGPRNLRDYAYAIAVDGNNNVFVTGYSYNSNGYGYATVAYSGAGVPMWTNLYDSPGNSVANAVAVDSSGNVFVTGSSETIRFSADYVTIAYSGAGVPLWTNRYDGFNSDDNATAIAVNGSGTVFVTGYSQAGNPAYATVAYSGAGVPLWTNRYNGPGNGGAAAAFAVAADDYGNVVVTGYSRGVDSLDLTTVAYSGAGVPLWTNRYNGPANGDDSTSNRKCLAIGPDGAVYVAGRSDGNFSPGTTYDYVAIKYTVTGLLPRLNSQIVGNQLVLSWTNAAFGLQSAPFVQGTYSTIPGATSPYTTPFSGTQRYFRLKAN